MDRVRIVAKPALCAPLLSCLDAFDAGWVKVPGFHLRLRNNLAPVSDHSIGRRPSNLNDEAAATHIELEREKINCVAGVSTEMRKRSLKALPPQERYNVAPQSSLHLLPQV